ncbi:hypothetical protein NMG60_11015789 [Bertholletia excelsa]
MGKLTVILLLLSMAVASPAADGLEEGPQAVETWFQELSHKQEKTTKLHFYFHDSISGQNVTAVKVVEANSSSQSLNSFGSIFVLDDPLTVGPEPTSTLVGRAQGVTAVSAMQEISLLMTLNLVFTGGEYNGSSLSLLGRNPILNQYREMPIVGGSGVFRQARGIATAKTYQFDATSGNAIVEYNVIVIHY